MNKPATFLSCKDRAFYGTSYIDSDYVFRWPNGKPIAPDYVSHRYSAILEANAMRHIRFHDLRHSCASMLLAMGYTLRDIAEWLGHANIKTTAKYAHLEVSRKASIGEKLATKINKKATPAAVAG